MPHRPIRTPPCGWRRRDRAEAGRRCAEGLASRAAVADRGLPGAQRHVHPRRRRPRRYDEMTGTNGSLLPGWSELAAELDAIGGPGCRR